MYSTKDCKPEATGQGICNECIHLSSLVQQYPINERVYPLREIRNYVSKITVSYFLILRGSLVVEVDSKIYTQQPSKYEWHDLRL